MSGALRSFYLRFGTLGEQVCVLELHFGGFWASFGDPGPGSGPLLGLLGERVEFWADPGRNTPTFWSPFWHPKYRKSQQKHKNTVFRKQSGKSVVPEHPPNGNMLILYSNYHMF